MVCPGGIGKLLLLPLTVSREFPTPCTCKPKASFFPSSHLLIGIIYYLKQVAGLIKWCIGLDWQKTNEIRKKSSDWEILALFFFFYFIYDCYESQCCLKSNVRKRYGFMLCKWDKKLFHFQRRRYLTYS